MQVPGANQEASGRGSRSATTGLSLDSAVPVAAVREWRGSLIAPITMHAVHNGLVFLLIWGLFL